MVYIIDESSEEDLAPDDILPWRRACFGERTKKATQDDLPIPHELHKTFVKIYIRRVVKWLGDQPVAFAISGIDFLQAVRDAWCETFPHHPHHIVMKSAVYDLVSDEYISDEETDLPH